MTIKSNKDVDFLLTFYSEHLSWEDLCEADSSLVASASATWPEIRGLVRTRLAGQLATSPESAATVGRFLGSLLSNSDEKEGTELLRYLDRLVMVDFLKSEVLRYTAAYISSSSCTESS